MSPPVTWLPTCRGKDHVNLNQEKGKGGPDSTLHSDVYPKTLAGGEFPFNVSVEGTNIYSSWDIDTLGEVIDVF